MKFQSTEGRKATTAKFKIKQQQPNKKYKSFEDTVSLFNLRLKNASHPTVVISRKIKIAQEAVCA